MSLAQAAVDARNFAVGSRLIVAWPWPVVVDQLAIADQLVLADQLAIADRLAIADQLAVVDLLAFAVEKTAGLLSWSGIGQLGGWLMVTNPFAA